jgi:hypothetical protein
MLTPHNPQLETLVGALSVKDSTSVYNLRKRPFQERKLPTFAAPDNFDCEIGSVNEKGELVMGDDLQKQAFLKMVQWVRAQPELPPSPYGNINRLLEGELTVANVKLALCEQISITEAEPSHLNMRRLENLEKLLAEVLEDQMSSRLISDAGALPSAISCGSSSSQNKLSFKSS